jgi:hypothetical protein
MADQVPLKVRLTGTTPTSIGQFESGDTIPDAVIDASAITATKIAASAITFSKIAASNVGAGRLLSYNPGSTSKLKWVDPGGLGTSAVNASNINTSAVIGRTIASLAITATKIAASAIITTKIKNSAVTASKINTGAVINAKLGASAVTSTKIAASTILFSKIAASNAASGRVLAYNPGSTSKLKWVDKGGGGGCSCATFWVDHIREKTASHKIYADHTIVGALQGNASTATSAGSATYATYVTHTTSDVTASRAKDTAYQNGSYWRMCIIFANNATPGATLSIDNVNFYPAHQGWAYTTYGICFMVPPSWYYKAVGVTWTLSKWYEA